MELYEEMLISLLRGGHIHLTVEGVDPQALLQDACYRALADIREILRRDDLTDPACFRKIEEIVEIYETLGVGTGRHDFG